MCFLPGSNLESLTPVFATLPKNTLTTPLVATHPRTQDLKLDYVLDTKSAACYAFFMLFFTGLATFLMCLTTFGWNRCFINSSLVMWRGCFFFFMETL